MLATPPSAARCAADLAWLVQSPPLLNLAAGRFSAQVQRFDAAQQAAIAAWLTQLDTADLHAFIAQAMPARAAMRLGRYAERLMEYFLRHAPLFTLAAANVQLKNTAVSTDHTTVGEFDYLLHDAAGRAWHWELAVKFYLCHATAPTAQPHDFKGPAGVDTLGLKLGKIFDKQLTHLPPAPYDGTVWQPAAYARGCLFYPHGQPVPPCDALNPAHPRGAWLGIAAFEQAAWAGAYVHLPRLHWLAPYAWSIAPELAVLTHAQVVQHLREVWAAPDGRQAAAAQMLSRVVPASASSREDWEEVDRLFVLPA